MEKIEITSINHFHDDDFDELNIRVNDHSPQNAIAEVVDDAHNAYLQLDPKTNNVVGATIIYADDWFAEIASAFQKRDANHPDVRFFLEQKIRTWTQEYQLRRQVETTAA